PTVALRRRATPLRYATPSSRSSRDFDHRRKINRYLSISTIAARHENSHAEIPELGRCPAYAFPAGKSP
ncbi:MAG: hypothetical protein KJO75_12775, partial [Dactylosporangium sp.]|nr:hypothetical protein [Dactylosporangium sp.]